MMRKIVTSPTHSPLPTRLHDWCAYYEGQEEAGDYGYGATPEAAIADFIENCQEDHDERLDPSVNLLTATRAAGLRPKLNTVADLVCAAVASSTSLDAVGERETLQAAE